MFAVPQITPCDVRVSARFPVPVAGIAAQAATRAAHTNQESNVRGLYDIIYLGFLRGSKHELFISLQIRVEISLIGRKLRRVRTYAENRQALYKSSFACSHTPPRREVGRSQNTIGRVRSFNLVVLEGVPTLWGLNNCWARCRLRGRLGCWNGRRLERCRRWRRLRSGGWRRLGRRSGGGWRSWRRLPDACGCRSRVAKTSGQVRRRGENMSPARGSNTQQSCDAARLGMG